MDDLKPCPFCGGDATVQTAHHAFWDVHIACRDCAMSGPLFDESPFEGDDAIQANRTEAITAWNTRAPDPRLAEVEAERDGLRDHLAWYADTFCEQGPYSEVCGKLSQDECAGCRARAALGAKP